ncbi:sugar ABC transporter permease [Microbacterium luteolum]|uniref:Sugar ABC transporter permease n=1 Tax=Microbacterium luteolum TaxID=69367 RepID=A0ABY7XTI7_MICLT|nr:sugar ABC transporter permease [Microbacterium luteolum]WDM44344.1 sugar ABC transporter permease [Microbacterium luteolum]
MIIGMKTRLERSPRRSRAPMQGTRLETAALVLPSLIPVLVLSVAPLIWGISLAFTDATFLQKGLPNFVGVENFEVLADYSLFWRSFGVGILWGVVVTAGQFLLGLSLALLLNTNLRLRGLARLLALLPWAMPPVVIAIIWQMIYSPTRGPLNWLLGQVGLPSDINWLGDFTWALPAVIVVGIWAGMPQNTVTLLAGLQQIPKELIEAAEIDGAGAMRRFVSVTLPSLRPIIVSITSLSFIWNFNSFGLVYVLTQGGPGTSTMLPMLFTYVEAFKSRDIALAAAMGDVIMLVIIVLLSGYLWAQFRERRQS